MSTDRKRISLGLGLLTTFAIVLATIFMPVFGGRNALEYLDDLYNSISKGSAYYIDAVREQSDAFIGRSISATLAMESEEQAELTALLYEKAGASAVVSGTEVKIDGDLGKILDSCLADADAMYHNNADKITEKYGYNERLALYNWWKSLKAMDKKLNHQKLFKEAKVVTLVKKKTVETSYNYYGVEPQKIGDRAGVVVFSLAFYVVYTLWYGFAIMYLFEGLGLRLGH